MQLYPKDNLSDYCSCSNNNIHNHLDFNSNLSSFNSDWNYTVSAFKKQRRYEEKNNNYIFTFTMFKC